MIFFLLFFSTIRHFLLDRHYLSTSYIDTHVVIVVVPSALPGVLFPFPAFGLLVGLVDVGCK